MRPSQSACKVPQEAYTLTLDPITNELRQVLVERYGKFVEWIWLHEGRREEFARAGMLDKVDEEDRYIAAMQMVLGRAVMRDLEGKDGEDVRNESNGH